jgi:Icc-related predicted phosphoesterase
MGLFSRKKQKRDGDTVTLFFATDLHGSEICWKKFVNAASFYGADLLVLGGDFTGKLVVPIIEQPDGTYRADRHGKEQILQQHDLEDFEKRIRNLGFYPTYMSVEEHAGYVEDPRGVDRLFDDLMHQRLVEWIDYAREKLAGSGVHIVTAPANDDPYAIDDIIEEHGGETLRNVEATIYEVADGHEMISTGWTNPTPWNTPREYPEPEIQEHIEKMAVGLSDRSTAIYNLHPPPYGSKLDLAPELDDDLAVQTSMGQQVMVPVGSKAVRNILEQHQPLLSLHGHIHESAGAVDIGRTLAINPGSEYGEGVLRGALVEVGGGKIHRHQATSG